MRDKDKLIEQYKKICRMADVPELIIENPFFIEQGDVTESDLDWANRIIKEQ